MRKLKKIVLLSHFNSGLTPLQRFALLKLSRSNQYEDKNFFLPAMQNFNLLQNLQKEPFFGN